MDVNVDNLSYLNTDKNRNRNRLFNLKNNSSTFHAVAKLETILIDEKIKDNYAKSSTNCLAFNCIHCLYLS